MAFRMYRLAFRADGLVFRVYRVALRVCRGAPRAHRLAFIAYTFAFCKPSGRHDRSPSWAEYRVYEARETLRTRAGQGIQVLIA